MGFWSRQDWLKIQPDDLGKSECVFCNPKNTPVLKEFSHWYICRNKYPYWENKDNLLVIPKKHTKYTYELSAEQWAEISEVEKFMKDYYGENNYFSFIRQSCAGRSLEHLHYHYIPGFISGAHVEHILQNQSYTLWKV